MGGGGWNSGDGDGGWDGSGGGGGGDPCDKDCDDFCIQMNFNVPCGICCNDKKSTPDKDSWDNSWKPSTIPWKKPSMPSFWNSPNKVWSENEFDMAEGLDTEPSFDFGLDAAEGDEFIEPEDYIDQSLANFLTENQSTIVFDSQEFLISTLQDSGIQLPLRAKQNLRAYLN